MRSKRLAWREKVVLLALVDLPAETDAETGRRATGSQRMDAYGRVALRQEYVASCLGCKRESIKEAVAALVDKGHLSLMHKASFGNPSKYQALINSGGLTPPLSGGETHGGERGSHTPTYGNQTSDAGRGPTPPPTYKTPDDRNHTPTSRGFQEAQITKKSAATREHDSTPAASRVTAPLVVSTHCQHGIENGDQPDPWLNGDLVCTLCRAHAKAAS